jgi:hypothetical protein
MMHRNWNYLSATVICGVVTLVAGCGGNRPQPADRGVAREILQTALESWKKGVTPTALQERDPSITVADREWAKGTRLLDYEVDDKDQLFGADLRCTVRLTLDGARGQPRKKKATYSVGTNQTFTVVREDDD